MTYYPLRVRYQSDHAALHHNPAILRMKDLRFLAGSYNGSNAGKMFHVQVNVKHELVPWGLSWLSYFTYQLL